jgi:hypothetical protein
MLAFMNKKIGEKNEGMNKKMGEDNKSMNKKTSEKNEDNEDILDLIVEGNHS